MDFSSFRTSMIRLRCPNTLGKFGTQYVEIMKNIGHFGLWAKTKTPTPKKQGEKKNTHIKKKPHLELCNKNSLILLVITVYESNLNACDMFS